MRVSALTNVVLLQGHNKHKACYKFFRHAIIKKMYSLKESDPDLARLLAEQVRMMYLYLKLIGNPKIY